MRLLVTGRNGQVATSLAVRAAGFPEIEVVAAGRPELDLEVPEQVKSAIAAARPDIVVNAAAYTAVDKAEHDEARAFAVNCDGAGAVAAAAADLGVPLVQLSTDYVYSGSKPGEYVESDATGPLGVYGASKLAGELAVRAAHARALVLRTSWVYSPYGANFVRTMLRLGSERPLIRVVDDQQGNPTGALDIADAILRIAPGLVAMGGRAETYHLAGTGNTSWYGFAREIFSVSSKLGGPSPELQPIGTADYPTPARRPANSRLSTAAFEQSFGFALRPWPEALAETVHLLLRPPS
ncbi:MAG: dTDP-4-dehydrorhamnose reductase [Rhizobiales bacterium]|nr:dTDP-4-dehydrorhamnose reductase [Hyphomicrobiales bacterium]MBI3674287.1 dTDP-4-dehydrorhamnose reductase [Hyphomicrobiales bacterium]